MDATSPLPVIAVTLVAYATCAAIRRLGPPLPSANRFETIDGLRGYLALFVFLHHACIWYFYVRTGQWRVPPSHLYTHLGQSGVAVFFMITGLLFYAKVLDAATRPIDWTRLYVGRLLRLAPLYFATIALVLLLVMHASHWTLHEPVAKLASNTARWLTFTVLGSPDINRLSGTGLLTAGVTWSLPYEWFFYLALPVIALLAGRRAPWPALVLSLVSLLGLLKWQPVLLHLCAFGGGMAAAVLVRQQAFVALCRHRLTSCVVVGLLAAVVVLFPNAYTPSAMLLLACAFVLIAGGCAVFGLLRLPTSRLLGEMTYSIYLLHGLMLFLAFQMLRAPDGARQLSAVAHWGTVLALTPVLVVACYGTFRCIEQPAMQKAGPLTAAIRSLAARAAGRDRLARP
ncbi:acyltransferase [Pseudorhodoferax sp. Leaf267]|uniref:acyltransferase family protein n=1 Tax=Pseudorhodoferax sp. Leaf267 TaxID=1736316 RepID=UPI0006F2B2A2|nr:acyltransferase [Pseudorhodoferax sp. Leaf267]KQP12476.1 hypothetical protein ASF43_19650 [Pseudorhodoferax sp. Leaf267]